MAKRASAEKTESKAIPKDIRDKLVEMAKAEKLHVEVLKAYTKITGDAEDRAIIVRPLGKGRKVYTRGNGWRVKHPAFKARSAEFAEKKHLGPVTGQLNFRKPMDVVLAGFQAALDELKS
jgi:hypothetical protein